MGKDFFDDPGAKEQEPKSRALMGEPVLEEILGVRCYWGTDAEIASIPVIIAKTGWPPEVDYEVRVPVSWTQS